MTSFSLYGRYSESITDICLYLFPVGVLTIFYVVFLIVVEYIWGGHTPGPIKHKPEVWTDVFAVIPVICFGYQVSIYLVFILFNVYFFSAMSQ